MKLYKIISISKNDAYFIYPNKKRLIGRTIIGREDENSKENNF